MMAKLIRALKLHYPKIQFLVIVNLSSPGVTSTPETLTMSGPLSQMISTFSHHAIMIIIYIFFSMQNYFRRHAPCESAPFGISPEVMDTYVKSCGMYKLDSPQDGCCFFP